ncbi:MAG: PTS transporter subunit EIIC [Collinsella sp.]|nr:PTS transporter subunit EIIC [Collinsella sp.]
MEQLIATIEKGQPFFNAIARNKYLKAIRDGFISVIPIIIFSSIFCLVASVPNIWGFYWPDDINNALWKCYNYSMGILAIACAATTAKHFADAQNRDLPKNNQINFSHACARPSSASCSFRATPSPRTPPAASTPPTLVPKAC